ncbi:hypothetical protein EDB85DRAFT_2139668 [Lactarius pseudohatsudake]|nr:hypothetical protein EDB85DRAFT_2139668 [Lactarius pseudohatsudake]
MAPRTRRSQMCAPTENTQGGRDEDPTSFQTATRTGQGNTTGSNNITIRVPPPTRGKRTFADTIIRMPSDTQPGAAKKARTIGPAHGRPMPLDLAHESEIVDQQRYDDGAMKGKQVQRQGAPSSSYPGRVTTHIPTHVPSYSNTQNFHNPDVDQDDTETEDDSEDEQIVELALKNPAKFAEVMATERPTLVSPGSVGGRASADVTPASTPTLPRTPGPKARLAELSATPSPNQATPESPVPSVSRIDTDLVFVGNTTKIMLTSQRPLIRAIVQDAIENLRASILFINAFPDATVAFALTRDALVTATENHGHGGGIAQRRLQVDDEYLTKLVSLTRARVPIFRGEVKDRCGAVSVAPIIAIGSATQISRLIRKQLSNYTYIFPGAPGNLGITGLVRTSLPYRNPRIITVIRDLYFTGGSTSFVSRFHHLFVSHRGEDGVERREVPMSMVALVATALYATLYEWRGGEQQITEFSANAYMDAYLANMNTLKHILNHRERAFHIMMSDIYTQASGGIEGGTVLLSTIPIANLDLDALE